MERLTTMKEAFGVLNMGKDSTGKAGIFITPGYFCKGKKASYPGKSIT